MDEPNHLSRGVTYVLTGDPRLSVEHPPLVNALSGRFAALTPNIRLPLQDASWERQPPEIFWYVFADLLIWDVNRDRVSMMMFLGRLPIVMLTMLLGVGASYWASRLWGGWAGLAGLMGVLFDPNILAHGRYITTDLGGAAFIFLATTMIWWVWTRPPEKIWRGVLIFAVVMGLAFTSKLLSLGFIPIWSVLALLPLYGRDDNWKRGRRRLAQVWIGGFFSIFVVWVIYGFEWGPFLFLDESLIWLNRFEGPMPTFWSGIERILVLSGGGRATFLLGELSTSGFWAYFPVALAVKTPLWTLGLLIVASVFLLWPRSANTFDAQGTSFISRGVEPEIKDAEPVTSRTSATLGGSSATEPVTSRASVTWGQRALFLFLPAVFYFAISMTSALNIGYRHLLPILPIVYVFIAGLWGNFNGPTQWLKARPWLLVLFIVPALWIHPHYLSYFNVAAGGPSNGHNILIDSNIDWGQDLIRLKMWMDDNDVDDIKLAWFGTADPSLYDISYEPLPGLPRHFDLWWAVPFDSQNPEPGIYVISASNLWELPLEEKTVFAWFRERQPDERIGWSLFVYQVE